MDLEGQNVYFPVESLVGLGHFNRTGKLVREMVKNGLDVTVASGTFVDPKRFFAGADCKEVPAYVFKAKSGSFFTLNADGKRTLLPDFNESAQKQQRITAHLKNIKQKHPDILVSEFWPFDRPTLDDEMQAMLQETKRDGAKLRVVSVRDVLDTPNETGPEAEAERDAREAFAIKTINENFDAVLVHGDPNFIPLSETFRRADEIKAEIIYTGYVIDDLPARRTSGRDPNAPILVSCGSGVDGHDMVFSFLTAWQKLLDRRAADETLAPLTDRPVHIVCGPRFSPQALFDVKEWAEAMEKDTGRKITVENYRDDFTDVLAGAAFSVSLAGYNTTLETLAMNVPSLLIPKYAFTDGRIRMSTEQLYRLERLEQQGLAAHAHPDDVQKASKFADILFREFMRQTENDKPRPQLNFSGAENTLKAISGILEKKQLAAPTL